MKTFGKSFVLLFSFLALSSCGASYSAQRSAEKEAERLANMQALVDSDFILDITQIIPRGFPSKVSTGEYQLRLEGDVVTTRLPFIGVSYEATYAGVDEISIVFEKEKVDLMTDFSKHARGEYRYRFRGGKGKEKWTVDIKVFDSGSATIECASSGGRFMTYFAKLMIPQKNEKQ
ncbi:MAG: DUF4251 domain-containing protein [Bacteroidales bacterium]|nr:DUF4251 domain-containing protein [Bacteroidales bacterium]